MEFNEKLQELRKSRGLTQEELAQALYVSRTAISKWESGRGYPSIDSLKAISSFFSVSVDDLLSGEKLIDIAEKENKSNIRTVCDLLFGIADVMALTLFILPLYPDSVAGEIYAVDLFRYSQASPLILAAHWVLFVLLFLFGCVKVTMALLKIEKAQKALTIASVAVGIVTVFFLALTREPYATAMAFLLLLSKGVILLKIIKADR
ncbi:MAG: helix-turn-helix transcriptional regulator [Ruminococcus sp.]|nr:helix-turn-helix transcriptional regulator [Ruminococcus sp.]MBR0302625.1 helix-turn-helix transcriptional regulator [Clostridia bacterium]